jgi:PAS domain S-box-containing protein
MDPMTFEALFAHSSLGIIISNEDGIIEKTNPFAARMFGYEPHELIGQIIEVLIPPPIREKHVTYRHQYNEHPHPRAMGSNLNLMAVRKSGELFPVEVSLTHYQEKGKRQIVSFVNDITVRKNAENELRRLTEELESKVTERTKELSHALLELNHTNEGLSQEMEQRKKAETQLREMFEREKELNELKSRFVSMASHEFRTPLAGIMTSISLIAKYPRTEDEPKREKHIQNIKRSVRNLTNILNDFLSLDKLEQGKISSHPLEFNLTQILDEIVQDTSETLERDIKLEIEHLSGPVTIIQDKEMVRNVIINLLSNAIKYSLDGKIVSLRTKLSGKQAIIEIEDRGIGIPEKDQKNMFERFFRAHNVTNLQGTGLGLNIVKRYLDLMGGHITFKSKENEGTIFIVTLPTEKK